MGISNDWQLIDNLTYATITDTAETYNSHILSAVSNQKFADAIGWEVVEMSDYVEEVTIGELTYRASDIRGVRPTEDYNTMLIPLGDVCNGNSKRYCMYFINLTTGTAYPMNNNGIAGYYPNIWLLRPTSNSGFCFWFNTKNTNYMIFADRFYNPKTEITAWGLFGKWNFSSGGVFFDMYTGLKLDDTQNPTRSTRVFNFGGFIKLKKYTAINQLGVYNARTIYERLIDYNDTEKAVELDGVNYVNVLGYKYYIALE